MEGEGGKEGLAVGGEVGLIDENLESSGDGGEAGPTRSPTRTLNTAEFVIIL